MLALVGLVVIGVLMGVGSSVQRNAWMQGYMMGRLAATSSDSGAQLPLPPFYGYPGGYYGPAPTGGFGWLFAIVLIVILFFVAKRAAMHAWRRHWGAEGGPQGGPHDSADRDEWVRRMHRMPPWWRGWSEKPGQGEGSEPGTRV